MSARILSKKVPGHYIGVPDTPGRNLKQSILFYKIRQSDFAVIRPSLTFVSMRNFTVLLSLVASLSTTIVTARVQFAGVNIAGCDFGCTDNVNAASNQCPSTGLAF